MVTENEFLNLAPNLKLLAENSSKIQLLADFLDERIVLRSRMCKLALVRLEEEEEGDGEVL